MKNKFKIYAASAAILAGLVVVINPEIRAFLLLADLIGAEAIIFMLMLQVQGIWLVLSPAVRSIMKRAGPVFSLIFIRTLNCFIGALGSKKSIYLPAVFVIDHFTYFLCRKIKVH